DFSFFLFNTKKTINSLNFFNRRSLVCPSIKTIIVFKSEIIVLAVRVVQTKTAINCQFSSMTKGFWRNVGASFWAIKGKENRMSPLIKGTRNRKR
ncbi:MAG: hypothetical protein ACKN9E_20125, partial [Microcystaceae cyanobacterium]